MYECFLDQVAPLPKYNIETLFQVLCALEVAGHYDTIGKQLMQYITLFFPRHIKRFRAQRYADRVGIIKALSEKQANNRFSFPPSAACTNLLL